MRRRKGIALWPGLAAVVVAMAPTASASLLGEATVGFSGPGPAGWVASSPEHHGLFAADLTEAVQRVAEVIPVRSCMLIAKE